MWFATFQKNMCITNTANVTWQNTVLQEHIFFVAKYPGENDHIMLPTMQ